MLVIQGSLPLFTVSVCAARSTCLPVVWRGWELIALYIEVYVCGGLRQDRAGERRLAEHTNYRLVHTRHVLVCVCSFIYSFMRIKWRYKPSEWGVCAVVCDWSNLSSKGGSGEVRYSVTQTETADCVCVCVEIELSCKAWSCLTLQWHSGRPKISGSCSVTQEPSHYSVYV